MAPTKSKINKHFIINKKTQEAICMLCQQKLKTSGNTTNLWAHLHRKHTNNNEAFSTDTEAQTPKSNESLIAKREHVHFLQK
ncbi:hypothetical protein ABEB36_009507 [Hypothenemus hampei]|uniref:BED-type domain-containing protein n=1 Tax=Hypothenemus hampei TaxID=57062 RepID=A0ABD1EGK7_HYPHA